MKKPKISPEVSAARAARWRRYAHLGRFENAELALKEVVKDPFFSEDIRAKASNLFLDLTEFSVAYKQFLKDTKA